MLMFVIIILLGVFLSSSQVSAKNVDADILNCINNEQVTVKLDCDLDEFINCLYRVESENILPNFLGTYSYREVVSGDSISVYFSPSYVRSGIVTEHIENAVVQLRNKHYKNDYEKIKEVYKYLSEFGVYDATKCDIYSSVIGRRGNCVGFTKAFNYLCYNLGINVNKVGNNNHVWSQVYLYGKWYNCDVTWDLGCENWGYFLKSDEEFRKSHEGTWKNSKVCCDSFTALSHYDVENSNIENFMSPLEFTSNIINPITLYKVKDGIRVYTNKDIQIKCNSSIYKVKKKHKFILKCKKRKYIRVRYKLNKSWSKWYKI